MQTIKINGITRSLALTVAAATTAALSQSADATMRYDCETHWIAAPAKARVINKPNGQEIDGAMCGSSISFTVGESASISAEVEVPGVGSFGASHSFEFSTSYTVTSQPCTKSRPVLVDTGGKFKVEVCKGWWWWENDSMTIVNYFPGTLTFAQTNETSNEISCICKDLGNNCPCGSTRSKTTTAQCAGSALESPSTSFMMQQLRTSDSSDRQVQGLGSLCRLELRMLGTVLEQTVLAGESERIVLTSPDGSIETFDTESFLNLLADREAEVVASDAFRDVNGDGKVNEGDAQAILESMGAKLATGGFDLRLDLNGNAQVDEGDFEIWLGH
jgi:hypothetical protein